MAGVIGHKSFCTFLSSSQRSPALALGIMYSYPRRHQATGVADVVALWPGFFYEVERYVSVRHFLCASEQCEGR